MATTPLHGLLDKFIDAFAAAIAAKANVRIQASAGPARRGGARMCPVPGCPNPGAGPRNRWFCRDHAKSLSVREQKKLLEARRGKPADIAPAARTRRVSPRKGKKLDMSCRVAGCKNVSRGPRFGFMCDKHRKQLSAKQQLEAREKWKAKHAA
jgi:hypothetical protein